MEGGEGEQVGRHDEGHGRVGLEDDIAAVARTSCLYTMAHPFAEGISTHMSYSRSVVV